MLLASCGGGYQAPISEQGEQQRITAPIIVDSSTPQSSLRVENSRPVTVSSSSGGNGALPEVISSNSGLNRGSDFTVPHVSQTSQTVGRPIQGVRAVFW